jgi:hypothetical protein
MSGIIVIVKAENQTLKKATEKTEQGSRANEGVAGGFAIPMG